MGKVNQYCEHFWQPEKLKKYRQSLILYVYLCVLFYNAHTLGILENLQVLTSRLQIVPSTIKIKILKCQISREALSKIIELSK